jgi:hypothetical protein
VESLSETFGHIGDIEGLRAGNIRRPADYAHHFSLAMSAPPAVEDFVDVKFTNADRPTR